MSEPCLQEKIRFNNTPKYPTKIHIKYTFLLLKRKLNYFQEEKFYTHIKANFFYFCAKIILLKIILVQ